MAVAEEPAWGTGTEDGSVIHPFTLTGFCNHERDFVPIASRDIEPLQTPSTFLNDNVVDMLLMHVGNVYRNIMEEQLEIITTITYAIWMKSQRDKTKPTPLSKQRTPRSVRSKRIIATPIHGNDPGHWALALIVDRGWDKRTKDFNPEDWILLYFDSFPGGKKMFDSARKYALFLLELDAQHQLESIQVPVIRQPPGSNDCGTYPAHFLRVFLADIDSSLAFCLDTKNQGLKMDSPKVKAQWKSEYALDLRADAWLIAQYYARLTHALRDVNKGKS